MISQTDLISDASGKVVDLGNFVRIVSVRVDIHIIRNGNIVSDFNPSSVVQQDMPVHDDVVAEGQIVAKRPLNIVPAFEVCPYALEDDGANSRLSRCPSKACWPTVNGQTSAKAI